MGFIAEGRGSKALAEALTESERKAELLQAEVSGMMINHSRIFKAPPIEWIEERVATFQETLERKTERSALLLRKLLGKTRLLPTKGDIGKPYYRAVSKLQVLTLLELSGKKGTADTGPNSLHWWRQSAGLSQAEVEERLGISTQAYQRMERPGRSNLTVGTLDRIATAIGKRLLIEAV